MATKLILSSLILGTRALGHDELGRTCEAGQDCHDVIASTLLQTGRVAVAKHSQKEKTAVNYYHNYYTDYDSADYGSGDGGEWWEPPDDYNGTGGEDHWMPGDDYAEDVDHTWNGTPVPNGMNPILNLHMECRDQCMREAMEADPNTNSTGLGFCPNFCGEGNACCRYNDALANADPTELLPDVEGVDYLDGSPKPIFNKECTAVSDAAYKDKWGFVEQIKTRCVFPKEGIPSNYIRMRTEAMDEAFKILNGDTGASPSTVQLDPDTNEYPAGTPYAGSWYGAPDLMFDQPAHLQVDDSSTFVAYARQKGVAPSSAYLEVGLLAEKLEYHDFLKDGTNPLAPGCCLPEWEKNCPAIGNSDYAINRTTTPSNLEPEGGVTLHVFNDRPYMHIDGMDIQVALYCGADYTDDHSEKTAIAAAKMAKVACDDMGDLCGGFSVGTDPELCGTTGGVKVIFLNPQAGSSTVDPNPVSSKTGKYFTNFFTWTK